MTERGLTSRVKRSLVCPCNKTRRTPRGPQHSSCTSITHWCMAYTQDLRRNPTSTLAPCIHPVFDHDVWPSRYGHPGEHNRAHAKIMLIRCPQNYSYHFCRCFRTTWTWNTSQLQCFLLPQYCLYHVLDCRQRPILRLATIIFTRSGWGSGSGILAGSWRGCCNK